MRQSVDWPVPGQGLYRCARMTQFSLEGDTAYRSAVMQRLPSVILGTRTTFCGSKWSLGPGHSPQGTPFWSDVYDMRRPAPTCGTMLH